LKERYTDPVAESAADGACCCDSLRDNLANMASDDQDVEEASAEGSSSTATSTVSNFPTVGEFYDKATNSLVLLRASMEELEEQWTQRVRDRRPFQYVVGCTHWRDLILSVQEGVLIPRPETEQMIDLAEAAIAADNSLKDGLWADLGTGSGALAIALARLLPSTGSVIALDASTTAVAVARRNVKQYDLMVSSMHYYDIPFPAFCGLAFLILFADVIMVVSNRTE
jgi:methylase of polypeptide subunit release factors